MPWGSLQEGSRSKRCISRCFAASRVDRCGPMSRPNRCPWRRVRSRSTRAGPPLRARRPGAERRAGECSGYPGPFRDSWSVKGIRSSARCVCCVMFGPTRVAPPGSPLMTSVRDVTKRTRRNHWSLSFQLEYLIRMSSISPSNLSSCACGGRELDSMLGSVPASTVFIACSRTPC